MADVADTADDGLILSPRNSNPPDQNPARHHSILRNRVIRNSRRSQGTLTEVAAIRTAVTKNNAVRNAPPEIRTA